MQRRPLDITTLMEGVDAESLTNTHDATGTGVGAVRPPKWLNPNSDLRGPAPGSAHVAETVPEAPGQDIPEDAINPSHYRRHPSGIECIEVTRHMNFNTGNAIKYIWRYLDKGDPVENLKKAQWYLDDEIRRLEGKR
jgi:Protein of unknwon function (DUF3310)